VLRLGEELAAAEVRERIEAEQRRAADEPRLRAARAATAAARAPPPPPPQCRRRRQEQRQRRDARRHDDLGHLRLEKLPLLVPVRSPGLQCRSQSRRRGEILAEKIANWR
jgi:hypothetical protein